MKLSNKPRAALLLLALAWNPCHAELADRDKPVHLEADQVSIDDARQIGTFEGSVQLTQGTLTIHGDKLVVVQDKDGNTHGTATGDPASLRQKRQGTEEYIEGFGNRIEYDTRAGTVELFGQARMKRQQDEVRGEYIIYNSRTETFKVSSSPLNGAVPADSSAAAQRHNRVRVIIQPKHVAPGPAPEPLLIRQDNSMENQEKIDE